MGKYEKVLEDVLSGKKDGNINFNELCTLLEKLGCKLERISGSHHIFSYGNVTELIDLQPDKKDHSKAKIYQVKQVRKFIEKYMEV
jgi:predicted RNA binding protein YcfA (HicA-like mRNA interferase family)